MWNDYENDTLIHHHIMATIYKKRYQRASDFQNSLYRLFGLITVISSTGASTISWGSDDSNQDFIRLLTTISAVSSAILNFYKFQELSHNFTNTAKQYALLQNKIELIGNIHPHNRSQEPTECFLNIQIDFDNLSKKRTEISNCMSHIFYNKKKDTISYLKEKHKTMKGMKIIHV
jgi:hypothetical protein